MQGPERWRRENAEKERDVRFRRDRHEWQIAMEVTKANVLWIQHPQKGKHDSYVGRIERELRGGPATDVGNARKMLKETCFERPAILVGGSRAAGWVNLAIT